MTQDKIYAELKDQNIFCTPNPYSVLDHLKDRSQYCIFNEDFEHTLATRKNFYFQLKAMMRRGELQKYVKSKNLVKAGVSLPWKSMGLNIQINETEWAGHQKIESWDKI